MIWLCFAAAPAEVAVLQPLQGLALLPPWARWQVNLWALRELSSSDRTGPLSFYQDYLEDVFISGKVFFLSHDRANWYKILITVCPEKRSSEMVEHDGGGWGQGRWGDTREAVWASRYHAGSDHFQRFPGRKHTAFLVQPDLNDQGCGLKSLRPCTLVSPLSEASAVCDSMLPPGLHFSHVNKDSTTHRTSKGMCSGRSTRSSQHWEQSNGKHSFVCFFFF